MFSTLKFELFKLIFLYFFLAQHHVCMDCNKTYKHASSLWKHRKYDCGKDPSFFCTAPGCAYKAKRKDHLKMHAFTHI